MEGTKHIKLRHRRGYRNEGLKRRIKSTKDKEGQEATLKKHTDDRDEKSTELSN